MLSTKPTVSDQKKIDEITDDLKKKADEEKKQHSLQPALTIKETAKKLGIITKSVHRLCKEKKLKKLIFRNGDGSGKEVMIDGDTITTYLLSRRPYNRRLFAVSSIKIKNKKRDKLSAAKKWIEQDQKELMGLTGSKITKAAQEFGDKHGYLISVQLRIKDKDIPEDERWQARASKPKKDFSAYLETIRYGENPMEALRHLVIDLKRKHRAK